MARFRSIDAIVSPRLWSRLIDSLYGCGANTSCGSEVKPGGGVTSNASPDHSTLGSKKIRCANPAVPPRRGSP